MATLISTINERFEASTQVVTLWSGGKSGIFMIEDLAPDLAEFLDVARSGLRVYSLPPLKIFSGEPLSNVTAGDVATLMLGARPNVTSIAGLFFAGLLLTGSSAGVSDEDRFARASSRAALSRLLSVGEFNLANVQSSNYRPDLFLIHDVGTPPDPTHQLGQVSGASSRHQFLIPRNPNSKPIAEARLAAKITRALQSAHVDETARESVKLSVRDAILIVGRDFPDAQPAVSISDDGVVTLHWRRRDTGIMLVFTGDGTAVYSIRNPGGNYAASGKEFDLSGGLPTEAKAAIERMQSL